VLASNSDEPLAVPLAHALLGMSFQKTMRSPPPAPSSTSRKPGKAKAVVARDVPLTTGAFKRRVEAVCRLHGLVTGRSDVASQEEVITATTARAMQAIRIEVNNEFAALDELLAEVPAALAASGGRAVMLTFHSGEDRRVKQAFKSATNEGLFASWSRDVGRAGAEERRQNLRSKSAKLRSHLLLLSSILWDLNGRRTGGPFEVDMIRA
jgi:hypothetical protein